MRYHTHALLLVVLVAACQETASEAETGTGSSAAPTSDAATTGCEYLDLNDAHVVCPVGSPTCPKPDACNECFCRLDEATGRDVLSCTTRPCGK